MPRNRIERRSSELRLPLPETYRGIGDRRSLAEVGQVRLYDAATGFYTMPALAEFIQYEIDGSAQTLRNELYVTPLCLVAIEVDGASKRLEEEERRRQTEAVTEALRRTTRGADRVARAGGCYVVLLRRTMAKNVRDFYAPRLAGNADEAAGAAGVKVTLSFGISSLTEHIVRDPDDLVRKAMRALEEARKRPGTVAIFDFRAMPLA